MSLPMISGSSRAWAPIKLAKKAANEGNPVYPVPVLMDANELMQLYFDVLEK
jgi:hypothetical protein